MGDSGETPLLLASGWSCTALPALACPEVGFQGLT